MSCGIYKITNLINNKIYIGQSSIIELRWSTEKAGNCGKKLKNAFLKYGTENFKFEIIEECSQEELNEKEMFYIKKFNSVQEGYNITLGGEGYRLYENSEENRKQKLKEYRIKNKEYYSLLSKQYRKEHLEEIKQYEKEYRENNTDKIKTYRKENKQHLKELNVQQYKKDKDIICFFENEFINYNALRAKLIYRTGSGKDAKNYIVKFQLTKVKLNCIIAEKILNKQVSPNLAN